MIDLTSPTCPRNRIKRMVGLGGSTTFLPDPYVVTGSVLHRARSNHVHAACGRCRLRLQRAHPVRQTVHGNHHRPTDRPSFIDSGDRTATEGIGPADMGELDYERLLKVRGGLGNEIWGWCAQHDSSPLASSRRREAA